LRSAAQPPQVGAERAHDAAVDHVQAPQQQRHAAQQVERSWSLRFGSESKPKRNGDLQI
jgi:hypothetical protein